MSEISMNQRGQTIGIDLGDRTHQLCVLDEQGQIVEELGCANTEAGLAKQFEGRASALVALEAGTHSGWVSQLLERWGHKVLVANPCKLEAISKNKSKSDKNDARILARLARVDPELLHPIRHRSRQAQVDLGLIKARYALQRTRTVLINHCRGIVKSMGARLASCSADCFARRARPQLPEELRGALEPLLEQIEQMCERIGQLDRQIEALGERYPDSARLVATQGVGLLTVLAFMLTLEDAARFGSSRQVGPFLGLVGRKDQSGQSDKQCRITKAGNGYLRMLLVLCAQHVLGPKGQPCELREWGLKLCERGGKAAKKRAVVAVARRLAVQLHALWSDPGARYDPYYGANKRKAREGAPPEPARADAGGA